MSGNVQQIPNIFSIVCMPVTALISGWERNHYIFSMCRYAQSCAFISVIELPRIPAYCPKIFFFYIAQTKHTYSKSVSKSSHNSVPRPLNLYFSNLLIRSSQVIKNNCSIVAFDDIWYLSKSMNASIFTSSIQAVRSSIK